MKIAMPVWENGVSPVFDTASRLLVVEVEGDRESSRFETLLYSQNLNRRCYRIVGLGVDTLICGAISRPFLRRLLASGVSIIPGISGHPEDVLSAYLRGDLYSPEFLMPGFNRNRAGPTTKASSPARRGKRGKKGRGRDIQKGPGIPYPPHPL